ncbi:MAG TPA: antibiotic biosynthesis monooxygenase family protein [Bacteroidia bacterium]
MITRIVKMTFRHEELENFMQLFEEVKLKIRNFEGCEGLSLLRDINNQNILFTYSHWQSENHLNQYRNSELFADTWKLTKSKFESKAEAWSVEQLVGIDNNK